MEFQQKTCTLIKYKLKAQKVSFNYHALRVPFSPCLQTATIKRIPEYFPPPSFPFDFNSLTGKLQIPIFFLTCLHQRHPISHNLPTVSLSTRRSCSEPSSGPPSACPRSYVSRSSRRGAFHARTDELQIQLVHQKYEATTDSYPLQAFKDL